MEKPRFFANRVMIVSSAWRFAIWGTVVWLSVLAALAVLSTQAPGPIKDASWSELAGWMTIPAGWLALIMAMLTRLAFNLLTPQRRKAYAVESIFLLVSFASQAFMMYQMVTIRTEG
ncbi:MAG: hypothetical protein K8T91_26115 [Planctomycetes bacterium]|nr:hypothetical protein [Planctomycetota bacterium]